MKSYVIILVIILIPQAFFWPAWNYLGEFTVALVISAGLAGFINSFYLDLKIARLTKEQDRQNGDLIN